MTAPLGRRAASADRSRAEWLKIDEQYLGAKV